MQTFYKDYLGFWRVLMMKCWMKNKKCTSISLKICRRHSTDEHLSVQNEHLFQFEQLKCYENNSVSF